MVYFLTFPYFSLFKFNAEIHYLINAYLLMSSKGLNQMTSETYLPQHS